MSYEIFNEKEPTLRKFEILTEGVYFDELQTLEDCKVQTIPREAIFVPRRTNCLVALLMIMAKVNIGFFFAHALYNFASGRSVMPFASYPDIKSRRLKIMCYR